MVVNGYSVGVTNENRTGDPHSMWAGVNGYDGTGDPHPMWAGVNSHERK